MTECGYNLLSAYDDDSHRYVRDKYVTECGYNLLSAYDDDSHRYFLLSCYYHFLQPKRFSMINSFFNFFLL